ncbi:MAG: hypothetical protein ACEPOW_14330 [Bacteroidales bacterium]
MMRKIIVLIVSLLLYSCASYKPGSIEYRSALTSPESKNIDSIYVYVKQYNYQEAKLIFDTDFRNHNFDPIYISVFNKSNSKVFVNYKSFQDFIDVLEVCEKTEKSSFGYLLGWSMPWGVNILVGLPFYYGVAWPVVGIAAMAKAGGVNSKRKAYYKSVALKSVALQKGQEIYGVVFIKSDSTKTIKLDLLKGDNSKVMFEFPKLNYEDL